MIFGSHRRVFGMNRRNRELIARLNPRRAILLANDKIACKHALLERGVVVPAMIAELRTHRRFSDLLALLAAREGGFVVKPAKGAQGLGVTIFDRVADGLVYPVHDAPWTTEAFIYYLSRILAGEFTVGAPMDAILVEERIQPDSDWIIPGLPGPPDLRVIVHRGQPVMAMARLPTLASEGRANLHRGGVGLGVDLNTGRSNHAIWREHPIARHPDTMAPLIDQPVEDFAECLRLSALCAKAVPLGYLGADIMRDKRHGPCVIEVNARPGLAIQLANQMGLGEVLIRSRAASETAAGEIASAGASAGGGV